MADFFAANLAFVYLLYGLSFLALGLVLGLQARTPIRPPNLDSLWLLAGFGFLHGLAEWAALGALLMVQTGQGAASRGFSWAELALTAFSFLLLMQFGLNALAPATTRFAWLRIVPTALLAIAAILLVTSPISGAAGSASWVASGQAMVRYLLAFPGGLLTALALRRIARSWPCPPIRLSLSLWGASVAFAVYAVLSGLIVPPAPFPPASIMNTVWFFTTLGFPVQVGRMVCAFAAAGFLAEAFVVESTWEYVRHREEVDRLKDEFISIASHELRAPLTPLRGYAQILLRRARANADRADERRALEAIIAQVTRLTVLVERLLDTSRLRAGRLELKRAPMDLVALASRLVEQFQLTSPKHRITLIAETPQVVGAWDRARLEEVLANLLDNAVKYSPGGGPVEVTVGTVDDWAQVAVRDHGVGIPKEAQGSLFERFYRVPVHGPRPPGLGLGLYISRQIMLLHGGQMGFQSEVGKGSTFYFSLPLAREEKSPAT